MPDREYILHRVRRAVGRGGSHKPPSPPPPRLVIPQMDREERILRLIKSFPGESARLSSPEELRRHVSERIAGRSAVFSHDPLLAQLGLVEEEEASSRFVREEEEWEQSCVAAEVGVGGVDYALADPACLVMLSSGREGRLVSLLPAEHVAIVPADRILSGLDELFSVLPDPAKASSSMVLIGGPSKTGDIEMTLTLGVHGPGKVSLLILENASQSADSQSPQ